MKQLSKINFKSPSALFYALMTLAIAGVPAFAAADLQQLITSALTSIKTLINSIFNPICVVALGICIVVLVLGRNSKSADASMSWAKRIAICFIVFNVLGSLLGFINTITGNGANGFANAMITFTPAINMIGF